MASAVFIETPVFTRQVLALLPDECYADMQRALAANPHIGDLIRGTGGLRKMRVAIPAKAKGKSAGARVIYYSVDEAAQIRLLLIYDKAEAEDLTAEQTKTLRKLIEEWK